MVRVGGAAVHVGDSSVHVADCMLHIIAWLVQVAVRAIAVASYLIIGIFDYRAAALPGVHAALVERLTRFHAAEVRR